MSRFGDTIVAPITGTAPAAVAVIRLSGDTAWLVASRIFESWPTQPEPRRAVYGHFVTGDDGLVLPFAEGHSYTGEEAVECSIHGSPASVRALLAACYEAGARPAEPGEFTRRAFMNGRLDLAQAESVRETIDSHTEAQLRASNAGREGAIGRQVRAWVNSLTGVLAAIEATTDFSEEIGDFDAPGSIPAVQTVQAGMEELIATARVGRLLRDGIRIAIVGAPNVGKSSLMNSLLGFERSIVTPIAGTTRDTVEEVVDLGGLPCRLIDTAGIRTTDELVEKIGIERAQSAAETSDLVLQLIDLSAPVDLPRAENSLLIGTKADLPHGQVAVDLEVSALTGAGLRELTDRIAEWAGFAALGDRTPIHARHEPYLRAAHHDLSQYIQAAQTDLPSDLLSTLIRSAIHHLGEITGETVSSDMVDRIFADFCIGK